jgi:hypothetical protein
MKLKYKFGAFSMNDSVRIISDRHNKRNQIGKILGAQRMEYAVQFNDGEVLFFGKEEIESADLQVERNFTKTFTKGERGSGNVRKSELNNNDECFICLEEYQEGEDIVLLHGPRGVKHHMHASHMSQLSNKNCPLCRREIHTVSSAFGKCVFIVK